MTTTLHVTRIGVLPAVEKRYDPSQPRDPKGTPTGGQWTSAGAAGGSASSAQSEHPEGKVTLRVKDFALGYEVAELQRFGVTKDQLERMLSLPGYDTSIVIGRNPNYAGTILVETEWTDLATKEKIGHSKREFVMKRSTDSDGWRVETPVLVDDELVFSQDFQNRGLAQQLYDKQVEILAKESSVARIRLYANISIGTYAWAKRGFQYQNEQDARRASGRFLSWAKRNGIAQPADGWPRFKTPQDVANFRLPGIKVPHTAIENKDIKPGDYEVGKAFMLDKNGHKDWYGQLWLKSKN